MENDCQWIWVSFWGDENVLGLQCWWLVQYCEYIENDWDFHGSPLLKTLPFNARDMGSTPGQGAKMPHIPAPPNAPKHKTEEIL